MKQNVSFKEVRKILTDKFPKVGVSCLSTQIHLHYTRGQSKFSANSVQMTNSPHLSEIPVYNWGSKSPG